MVCTCQDNILKMPEQVAIFNDMDQQYVNLLKPLFERYSCPSGFTVIEQGQPADYLYVILDGKVQVTYKPYDGTPITVAHVEKDGVFGWSAVVGSRTYTSSVTAIEDLDTFRSSLIDELFVAGNDVLGRRCRICPRVSDVVDAFHQDNVRNAGL